MIVYVDTSALLRRVIVEPESPAVRSLLARLAPAGHLLTSSALTWVEVARALRRAAPRRHSGCQHPAGDALSGIDELPLRPAVLDRARTIGPVSLRSLDAIHLASAVGVQASHLLTYDDELAAAAGLEGIEVLSPAD